MTIALTGGKVGNAVTKHHDELRTSIAVTSTLGYTTTFTYDADGQRVLRKDPAGATAYIGAHFEQLRTSGGITNTSYYYFGSQRVAMRVAPSGTLTGTVYWIHGDHLGSASLTTNISGQVVSEMRFYPFGEVRWQNGSTPTDRTFTGQLAEPSGLGSLMNYNAREYSPVLGRFLSADTIVPNPGSSQSLNRYSYVENSPLIHIDPSGHGDCNVYVQAGCFYSNDVVKTAFDYSVYRIQFSGLWTKWRAETVLRAAALTEGKLRMANEKLPQEEGSAWRAVFGIVTVRHSNETDFGWTQSAHLIDFGDGALKPPEDGSDGRNFLFNVLHEFGHAFNASAGGKPSQESDPSNILKQNGQPVNPNEGFSGGNHFPYRQHPYNPNEPDLRVGEEFADMYLNWVLGSFTTKGPSDPAGAGDARQTWMDNHMVAWTALAVSNNEPKTK